MDIVNHQWSRLVSSRDIVRIRRGWRQLEVEWWSDRLSQPFRLSPIYISGRAPLRAPNILALSSSTAVHCEAYGP